MAGDVTQHHAALSHVHAAVAVINVLANMSIYEKPIDRMINFC